MVDSMHVLKHKFSNNDKGIKIDSSYCPDRSITEDHSSRLNLLPRSLSQALLPNRSSSEGLSTLLWKKKDERFLGFFVFIENKEVMMAMVVGFHYNKEVMMATVISG
ncbi:hypothetical protein L6452_18543 [Arctium lappa]|uniref:Uncharacterized protein n=1 Tax=Arctium lappa TaxID=4217 RepID=A0ACB9C6B4_ARCLA|nr:hypothetical protein L6452_18543 [Arctium lappa]